MAISAGIALVIGSIISAIAGAGSAIYSAEANKKAVKASNETNIALANQANAATLDVAQHGLSYRMADAAEAGLNPVFAATGGASTPSVNLSTPNVRPATVDYSGIGNAITAMNNTILTKYLIDSRYDIAKGYMDTSRTNNESRNSVLKDLYKRKGKYFDRASDYGNLYTHSAKQISNMTKRDDVKWEKMLKELDDIPYKYK